MKNAPVVLEKCSTYDSARIERLLMEMFEHLGGVSKFIRPNMRVVLKPNLLSTHHPDDAVTTHPAIIEAIAKIIKTCEASVVIVESPAGPHSIERLSDVYDKTGVKMIAEQVGISLNYDLAVTPHQVSQGKILKVVSVLKPLLDADLVINLPKLKTHSQMVFTGAVKNMFGAIPGLNKIDHHLKRSNYFDFADSLIDIFLSVKPQLNIMDGIVGMDGAGPSAGNPFALGVLLMSENAFSLDMIATSIIKLESKMVPILHQAIARGLCPEKISDIPVLGKKIIECQVDGFRVPALSTFKMYILFKIGPLRSMGQILMPHVGFDYNLCVGCEICVKHCPARALAMTNKKPVLSKRDCIHCYCCQELCPKKAITIRRSLIGKILFRIGQWLS